MSTATVALRGTVVIPRTLALEVTGLCQLVCTPCYAMSGPQGDHGTMSVADWCAVIDAAARLGVHQARFIGGEATLFPGLPDLVRYSLAAGLKVEVYTNLVHVTPAQWTAFALPGVRVATSYYSPDPAWHDRIIGRKGSHARTRANIIEALKRDIILRVSLINTGNEVDVDAAQAELRALGVMSIGRDRVRPFGRAAEGTAPDPADLCGGAASPRQRSCPTGSSWRAGWAAGSSAAASRRRRSPSCWPASSGSPYWPPCPATAATPANPKTTGRTARRRRRRPASPIESLMVEEEWRAHARDLAGQVTHPGSRWYEQVAGIPRHLLVPAWWERDGEGWALRRGPLVAAYADRSLVTRVGPLHADHASDTDRPEGRPTSSSTAPSLVVKMYRYAHLEQGLDIADIGTGSGYGAALLARRYGDQQVTTLDVDPYLVDAAADRLSIVGLFPTALAVDATGPLPGAYDRIVSMVSVPSIPPSWLAALRPGGRLVTTIRDTWMIITATKGPDGVFGQVERDWAGFMGVRSGPNYPPAAGVDFDELAKRNGEQVGPGRYPVLHIADAWELSTMLHLAVPGIEHRYHQSDGRHTALMAHPDGSWARATAVGTKAPTVYQGGPRRLWDALDEVRDDWLRLGWAPFLGARAMICDDGTIKLLRGDWRATIPAAPAP